MRVRAQIVRGAAAVAIGLAAAMALPAAAGASTQSAVQTAAAPTVSITASPTRVHQWQQFVLSGRATATPAGAKVVVQRLEAGRWVTFPASSVVTRSGSYSVRVKSGRIGVQKFRVATSKAASKAVSVTVVR
jgi:hypothetical protein